MNLLKTIIIDRDTGSRTALANILQDIQGVEIRVEETWGKECHDAVAQFQPDLIIINLAPDENTGLDLAENLQKQYNQLIVIVTAPQMKPEIVRRAMRSGVREFLQQPFSREEVDNAIQAAMKQKGENSYEKAALGQVITLFGVKGGMGVTTLASNLAVVMARTTGKKVILLDLHLQLGNDSLFLNLKSKYSISDVVNHLDSLDVPVFLKTLPRHSSGLCLLPSPFNLEEADYITGTHIEQLVTLVQKNFDLVIIDTHAFFDEVTLKALDAADKILLISALDLASIFNSKRCVELFLKMGYPREKINIVLNRYASYAGADLAEMEKLLEFPVFARIPAHDLSAMLNSINRGVPLVEKSASCKMSEGIRDMAQKLSSGGGSDEDKSIPKGGLFKKFLKK